jgi:hypothetical protein
MARSNIELRTEPIVVVDSRPVTVNNSLVFKFSHESSIDIAVKTCFEGRCSEALSTTARPGNAAPVAALGKVTFDTPRQVDSIFMESRSRQGNYPLHEAPTSTNETYAMQAIAEIPFGQAIIVPLEASSGRAVNRSVGAMARRLLASVEDAGPVGALELPALIEAAATIEKIPQYEGLLTPTGSIKFSTADSGYTVDFDMHGLEPSGTGYVALYEGSTCAGGFCWRW